MILIFFFREKISRFGKKEEMYHFLKFLLEIFATLKSFQLIDSFIPWLAQQETKFLHGWSNVSCARSGERGSLPCRVEIYTPNKEEDEWGGNRSKEVSLCLSLSRGKSYTVFFLCSGNGCIDFSFTSLFVLFPSSSTDVRNLLKFQFISRDSRCLNIPNWERLASRDSLLLFFNRFEKYYIEKKIRNTERSINIVWIDQLDRKSHLTVQNF